MFTIVPICYINTLSLYSVGRMLNYNSTSDCIKLIGTLTMTCLLCRVRSFLSPANPGVTAAEALPAPFFTFVQGDEVLLEV